MDLDLSWTQVHLLVDLDSEPEDLDLDLCLVDLENVTTSLLHSFCAKGELPVIIRWRNYIIWGV